MHRSSFDQRYVHKLDPWAVLVTDVPVPFEGATLDPGTSWAVDVVLPLAVPHPVYAQQSAVLLALEAFRQAGTALAHVAGGVPLGHAFVATRVAMRWTVDPAGLTGEVPARFTFRTLHAEHRRGMLVQHLFEADVTIDDVLVAHASGDLQCVDPRVHARLRASAPAWQEIEHRYDPAVLGDVRTTAGTLEARLGWNAEDRMSFDHGVDHVPAMHLARAALTAHHLLTAAPTVTAVDIRCSRYVELAEVADVQTERAAHPGLSGLVGADADETCTQVVQGGQTAAVIICATEALVPLHRPAHRTLLRQGHQVPLPRRLGTAA
jgi:2-oxo-3-(phosphooxy)propyl 3-oxoalkanoate synthase